MTGKITVIGGWQRHDTDDNTDVDVESDAADVVIEDADEKSESAAFESGEDDDYKADADDVSDESRLQTKKI